MSVRLLIVTPEGERYQGEVETVVLPGSEGDFGVLSGHERFLSPLRIGELLIREPAGERFAAVSTGFADVSSDEIAVMVETCELAEDIDVARAERARERAERSLAELGGAPDEDRTFLTLQAALQRAVTRISAAERAR